MFLKCFNQIRFYNILKQGAWVGILNEYMFLFMYEYIYVCVYVCACEFMNVCM